MNWMDKVTMTYSWHNISDQYKNNTIKCDPPQDFTAKGESTCTTRFQFKKNNLF